MNQILKTVQAVGVRRLLRLYRAYRLGWQGIISGFYTTRIMQTLFNVGFFDEMLAHGKVNLSEFARANNLDEKILQSLCDSLYALRILEQNGTGYLLTQKGESLAEVARGWFDLVYGYEDIYHSLEDLLRKEATYGEDVHRRSDFVARGSGEIEKWIYFPLAADLLRDLGASSVLDMGCGDGTFLRHVCRERELRGFGVDMAPAAIREGERQLNEEGMADQIQLFVLDVTQIEQAPAPLRSVDAATMFFVLHEVLHLGEDALLAFLGAYRRLFPGVPLLAFEVIRPTPEQMRRRPGMVVQYTLYHDLTNQVLVDSKRWKELFHRAGFTSVEEMHLQFAHTSVFTLR